MNQIEILRHLCPFLRKEIIGEYFFKKKGRGNHRIIRFVISEHLLRHLLRCRLSEIKNHFMVNKLKNFKFLGTNI